MSVLLDILTEIRGTSLAACAAWPTPELDRAIRQLSVLKDQVRACDTVLQAALAQRYQEAAQRQRQLVNKTTGTVRFDDGDYQVIADLPKRPEYDQAKLQAAVDTLRSWGENPDDYVTLEIKVAESQVQRLAARHPQAVRTGPHPQNGQAELQAGTASRRRISQRPPSAARWRDGHVTPPTQPRGHALSRPAS